MRQKARLWLKSSGNFRSETGGTDFQACWTVPLSPLAEPDLFYETVPQSDSSVSKESACNAGDPGSIPGSGRSPEERKGYPLQYPDLENSMDYTVHGVASSQTGLNNFHFHFPQPEGWNAFW